ncbi:hypothetical protein L6164_022896 [Bauhinia variegata]|uniref:Uncharacterized protein n=1 Tax=Bauhinia variegata TaxID=167791 RepID=A0ACB9MHW2_BAUVA|nr:hypothetical protein L6164_022896 [Bauhinia variegata]
MAETEPESLDEFIEQSLGHFGWKHFIQSILVSLSLFFDSQQAFIGIYSDANPTWHCTNSTICSLDSDICKLPKSAWSWDGPSSMSIISQWGLECANSFISGLPQSSFFMGSFIGGILLATAADSSLGRKNLLFLSCFLMSLTSMAIVFSTNVWIYSALKFLIGFSRSTIVTCALVLKTEKVSKKWRFRVNIVAFFTFALGYLSLPAIAYVNKDSSWKYLYLWSSIPAICYSILAYFFVTESPRWLFMQGREEEAMKILKEIAPTEDGGMLASRLLEVPLKPKAPSADFFSSIGELFGKMWATLRILAVMVITFGIGMVYYGTPLGVGNLGFDIYLAVIFNALLEIPSFIVTYLLENCRRRYSILSLTSISGICSILCVVVGNGVKGAKIWLELASFFCACTANNVCVIYTMELFPTCVRNTATALARQAGVFGAVFCPFLISAGRRNDLFSFGVFGVIILCCGIFVAYLPETKGVALSDTMDQQESKESTTM